MLRFVQKFDRQRKYLFSADWTTFFSEYYYSIKFQHQKLCFLSVLQLYYIGGTEIELFPFGFSTTVSKENIGNSFWCGTASVCDPLEKKCFHRSDTQHCFSILFDKDKASSVLHADAAWKLRKSIELWSHVIITKWNASHNYYDWTSCVASLFVDILYLETLTCPSTVHKCYWYCQQKIVGVLRNNFHTFIFVWTLVSENNKYVFLFFFGVQVKHVYDIKTINCLMHCEQIFTSKYRIYSFNKKSVEVLRNDFHNMFFSIWLLVSENNNYVFLSFFGSQ